MHMSINMDILKSATEKLLGHPETATCILAFGTGSYVTLMM